MPEKKKNRGMKPQILLPGTFDWNKSSVENLKDERKELPSYA